MTPDHDDFSSDMIKMAADMEARQLAQQTNIEKQFELDARKLAFEMQKYQDSKEQSM